MNAVKNVSRTLRITWLRTASTSPARKDEYNSFIEELKKQVEENTRIIRKYSYGDLRARQLESTNSNLKIVMENVNRKIQDSNASTISNIPSKISIEVLANGSGHVRPCVIIRSTLKTYMFNCPEGTSRFLPQLRLKAINVTDVFVTRAIWNNIAGIPSLLLSKESNALATRLHGALNIRNYLESIRAFQDSDFGSDTFPSPVEEYPFTAGTYEDAGLKVTYLPLAVPSTDLTNKHTIDIAYFVEIKEAPRRIDPMKLINKGVPKGPAIGKLKAGEAITLSDGRVIHPEDVFVDGETGLNDKKRVLIVDCATPAHLKAFCANSLFEELKVSKQIDYVVHFTPQNVVDLPIYSEAFKTLGSQCQHIVVNGKGPSAPGIESVYRHQYLLNRICPEVFTPLYPSNWNGLMSQGNELQRQEDIFTYAAPIQRFWMRHAGDSDPILLDLRLNDSEINEEASHAIMNFREDIKGITKEEIFPRVTFLGTSSACPSKYRNVTGYLLETSSACTLMIDVGEGSFGQMRMLFGDDGLEKMLLKLRAVMITHAHQDHMNGLYTIIQQRRNVFLRLGMEYQPLILVCNRNVLKPMKTFSFNFEDVESLVEVVDMSSYPVTPPPSPGPPNKKRRLPTNLTAVLDVLDKMPDSFNKEFYNIQEIKSVQVHHTRMANGFVIGTNGKRVVFSGDTKPCDLLAEEGKGADLLIHESTFEDGHEKDAFRKKHSTMGQAVNVGKKMEAKNVILTHFSARYPKVPALPSYLDTEGNIGIAMDNMQVAFGHLPLLPKLIPVYRKVFKDELWEIELRKCQRDLKAKINEEQEAKLAELLQKQQQA